MTSAISILTAWALLPGAPPVNPHSAVAQEFTKRVDEYMKVRKSARGEVPKLKPTESQAVIKQREKELAGRIRAARPEARQGDIFTPAICAEFERLIGLALKGGKDGRVSKSLRRAEPVAVKLEVNSVYPAGIPLQSMPPTLIANLPPLPKELEYRIVGNDIVLLDIEPNLVVDIARGCVKH